MPVRLCFARFDLEIVGVVGASDHGGTGDVTEAHGAGLLAVPVELFGGNEFHHGQVGGGGPEVLPQGDDFATDLAEVLEGGEDLVRGLAQAEHEAGLGPDPVPADLPGP